MWLSFPLKGVGEIIRTKFPTRSIIADTLSRRRSLRRTQKEWWPPQGAGGGVHGVPHMAVCPIFAQFDLCTAHCVCMYNKCCVHYDD